MESHISPNNIEQRVTAMAAAEAKPEVVVPEVKAPEITTPEVKAPEVKAPVVAPEIKPEVKVEVKAPEPEVKPEKKQPNDPAELRKWSTKLSQENAALRDEMKAIKAAIEKLSKKPVDYKELAKDPEAIRKQIEVERQEAASELQTKLTEATNKALRNETMVAKMEFERDTENYPRWNKLFPLIQNLAANSDGRVKFNDRPAGDVLHDLYVLADQLSPSEAPAAVVPPVPAPAPVAAAPVVPPVKTYTEAEVEAIKKEAFDKAQQALVDEGNGAGVGSSGKGGRRSSGVSREALQKMDRSELKKLISQ